MRQGRLDLVEQYCHEDVEVRRDLYLHDRREGCVTDKRRRTTLRLRVEW